MSKRETPMTRRYWERVRGTLLEEYLIVPSSSGVGRRMIDAVIIEDGDHRIASRGKTVSLDGHDIVVVQTKAAPRHVPFGASLFLARVDQGPLRAEVDTHDRAMCH